MQQRSAYRGNVPESGQPSALREMNARRLLESVRELGPVSRPELARHLDLSSVTIASIARSLVEAGVLLEVGTRGQGVGRKAAVLDVAPTAGMVLAVDVRLDEVAWRTMDLRGATLERDAFAMPADAERLVAFLADLTSSHLAQAAKSAIVVAVPATVRANGVVHYFGTPGMLHGVDLAARLAERVDSVPVVALNDINLAAMGEHRLGAAREWSRFVFIGIRRTGIGMGLVIDGHLYQGAHGRAGEIGNLRIGSDGMPLDTHFVRLSPEALDELAKVLAVTFAVLDLDGVVVHSEIERGYDWFTDLDAHLGALVPFRIRTTRSALGDDAVLLGASLVGLDTLWPRLAEGGAAGTANGTGK
ncbi:MAG: ROK family protein [Trueperaceae bacterium]